MKHLIFALLLIFPVCSVANTCKTKISKNTCLNTICKVGSVACKRACLDKKLCPLQKSTTCSIPAEKDVLKNNFKCDGAFSYSEQVDLMALSGNIYYSDKENSYSFRRRYDLYTTYLGGSHNVYLEPKIPPKSFLSPNPLCAITQSGNTYFVVCRGTVKGDFSTLYTDFQPGTVNAAGIGSGYVNTGFFKAYKSIESQLIRELKKIGPDARVYCTGHSSGGALATFICEKAKVSYCSNICGVYTFGSPTIGAKSFADNYLNEEITYRFEMPNDPIPQLPTYYPNTFHLGPINVVQSDGYVKVGSDNGHKSTCKLVTGLQKPTYNQIFNALFSNIIGCNINVHYPDKYCDKFRKRPETTTVHKLKCGQVCTNNGPTCFGRDIDGTNKYISRFKGIRKHTYTLENGWEVMHKVPTVSTKCNKNNDFESSMVSRNILLAKCGSIVYSPVVRKTKSGALQYGFALVTSYGKGASYSGNAGCCSFNVECFATKVSFTNSTISVNYYFSPDDPKNSFFPGEFLIREEIVQLSIKVKTGALANEYMYGDRKISSDTIYKYVNSIVNVIPKNMYLCTHIIGVSFNTRYKTGSPGNTCSPSSRSPFDASRACSGNAVLSFLCNANGEIKAVYSDRGYLDVDTNQPPKGQFGTFTKYDKYIILAQNLYSGIN